MLLVCSCLIFQIVFPQKELKKKKKNPLPPCHPCGVLAPLTCPNDRTRLCMDEYFAGWSWCLGPCAVFYLRAWGFICFCVCSECVWAQFIYSRNVVGFSGATPVCVHIWLSVWSNTYFHVTGNEEESDTTLQLYLFMCGLLLVACWVQTELSLKTAASATKCTFAKMNLK